MLLAFRLFQISIIAEKQEVPWTNVAPADVRCAEFPSDLAISEF